jgi:hypothetical protein
MKCIIGVYCRKHGFVHGAEAEELRQRLGELLNVDSETQHHTLQDVLDDVDARDSLAYLEANGPVSERTCATCRHDSVMPLCARGVGRLVGIGIDCRKDWNTFGCTKWEAVE